LELGEETLADAQAKYLPLRAQRRHVLKNSRKLSGTISATDQPRLATV
jgi:hypothetical protein